MSFPKIVNQMGPFGQKRKNSVFRFCRPILDIFRFTLLTAQAEWRKCWHHAGRFFQSLLLVLRPVPFFSLAAFFIWLIRALVKKSSSPWLICSVWLVELQPIFWQKPLAAFAFDCESVQSQMGGKLLPLYINDLNSFILFSFAQTTNSSFRTCFTTTSSVWIV